MSLRDCIHEGNAVEDFYSTDYRQQLIADIGAFEGWEQCQMSVWLAPNVSINATGGYPDHGVCALHLPSVGDLSDAGTPSEIETRVLDSLGRGSETGTQSIADDAAAFVNGIAPGDFIVTFDLSSRKAFISRILGDYAFRDPIWHLRSIEVLARDVPLDAIPARMFGDVSSVRRISGFSGEGAIRAILDVAAEYRPLDAINKDLQRSQFESGGSSVGHGTQFSHAQTTAAQAEADTSKGKINLLSVFLQNIVVGALLIGLLVYLLPLTRTQWTNVGVLTFIAGFGFVALRYLYALNEVGVVADWHALLAGSLGGILLAGAVVVAAIVEPWWTLFIVFGGAAYFAILFDLIFAGVPLRSRALVAYYIAVAAAIAHYQTSLRFVL